MMIATQRQTQTLTPEFFCKIFDEIGRAANRLYNRALAGEPMTSRDVAMAAEYLQTYIDILEIMEDAPVVFSGAGRVSFE
jgi:hypothetical protein